MGFNLLGTLGSIFSNPISNIATGAFTGDEGSVSQFFSDPASWWDVFQNGKANSRFNTQLNYQMERDKIADARYEEELGYNRAWNENQRDYERALQQEIFNREDTAFSRLASDASQYGINPMALAGNSASSGQVVSNTANPGAAEGNAQNSVGGMDPGYGSGVLSSVAPLMSMISGFNNVSTGAAQRDLLQSQVDAQNLKNQTAAIENLILMDKNGVVQNADGTYSLSKSFENKEQDFSRIDYENKEYTHDRNWRVNYHQSLNGTDDQSSPVAQLAGDFGVQSGRFLDGVIDIGKGIGSMTGKAVGKVKQKAINFLASRADDVVSAVSKRDNHADKPVKFKKNAGKRAARARGMWYNEYIRQNYLGANE